MTVFADTLTGGIIVGTIFAAIIAFGCFVVMVLGFFYTRSDERDAKGGWWAVGIAGICLVATVGVYVWSSWPLAYEYHHWVDKEGKVAEINKRLVPAGDAGMQEKIVVRFQEGAGIYGITETRATLLKEGMNLHMRCKKAYDFGVNRGAHGWDCKYVSSDLDKGVQ